VSATLPPDALLPLGTALQVDRAAAS